MMKAEIAAELLTRITGHKKTKDTYDILVIPQVYHHVEDWLSSLKSLGLKPVYYTKWFARFENGVSIFFRLHTDSVNGGKFNVIICDPRSDVESYLLTGRLKEYGSLIWKYL